MRRVTEASAHNMSIESSRKRVKVEEDAGGDSKRKGKNNVCIVNEASPQASSQRPRRQLVRKAAPSSLFTSLFHSNGPHPDRLKGKRLTRVNQSPNIYVIDDFLTAGELQHLHSLIADQSGQGKRGKDNFKSSYTDDGSEKLYNEHRTSKFIHLSKAQDRVARAIEQRASDMIGAQTDNVEPIQIVTYTEGQRFDLHHDAGSLDVETGKVEIVPPRRIATFFVYLNTLPLGIGHTAFPYIKANGGRGNLSVQPKAGRALLFCNLDEAGEADVKTCHQACLVPGAYTKWGMNVWVSDSSQQAYAFTSPAEAKKRGEDEEVSSLIPESPNVLEEEKQMPPEAWIGKEALMTTSGGKNGRDIMARVQSYDSERGVWLLSSRGVSKASAAGKENRMRGGAGGKVGKGGKGGMGGKESKGLMGGKGQGEEHVWEAEVNFDELCVAVSQSRDQ